MITGLSMEVGDGRRTRFWEDVWIHGGSLKDRFPKLFSVSNQTGSMIGDCVAGGNGPGGYIKLQFHKDYLERPGPSQSRVVYLVCPDWQSQYEGETESAWGHSPRR
ncbi:hypothetical protein AHAS_Ahas20G0172300 [Arachis hypogaea]